MDILVSSNLERLIYHLTGDSDGLTSELMQQLNEDGEYRITDDMLKQLGDFYADFADEAEIASEISKTFEIDHYVEDPHTAVASAVYKKYTLATGDKTPTVVVSTASPYKFPRVVVDSLTGTSAKADDFELVKQLADLSKVPLPKAVSELFGAPVLHRTVIATSDMQNAVTSYLELD